nr:L-threonylcarbamoyladenylate synthase [Nannocystis pusilla]
MSVKTAVLPADDPAAIARAAEVLQRGGLVAFPTETVYGLGADALDAAAVGRIFAAKGRPADNPLIVHVAAPEQARALARVVPPAAEQLMSLWPGPLTLVLPRAPVVPDATTAGQDTVAVRIPGHPAALALLRVRATAGGAVGQPLGAAEPDHGPARARRPRRRGRRHPRRRSVRRRARVDGGRRDAPGADGAAHRRVAHRGAADGGRRDRHARGT